ncbi:lipase family protein [Corynebacterium variabile]|uniref:lipase family protein n=1 Tax=Corynebacterium variabile TaxID=1727 RepID=UPI0037369157
MNPHSTVHSLRRRACAAVLVPALGLGLSVASGPVTVAAPVVGEAPAEIATVAGDADFFALPDATGTAATDLASLSPGTPLTQRSAPVRINNLGRTPVTMTQIQYRTTTVTEDSTVAVTSVLQPPAGVRRTGDTVMYASFYDSMNPEDGPSRVLARGAQSGMLDYAEAAFVTPLLAAGHTVVMPDIQGERGIFAVGVEYGQIILDGLRASRDTPAAGVAADSKTALTGYSGGSIGTGWAGIIADDYAPDIARNIVGVAEGGVMVHPEHNLAYGGEGAKWSGVVGMALTGMAAAYGDDLSPYLTDLGKKVVAQMVGVKIDDAENTYDHLRWEELFRPEYPTPDDVPPIRAVLDDTNMGLAPVPSYPYYIGQSGGGADQQKTPVHPMLGDGDGAMLLGDTRGLAQYYCDAGTTVQYEEYLPIGHTYAGPYWATQMVPWVNARFAGQAAPSTCGSVPAGNSLTD